LDRFDTLVFWWWICTEVAPPWRVPISGSGQALTQLFKKFIYKRNGFNIVLYLKWILYKNYNVDYKHIGFHDDQDLNSCW
jgi:hypothetical protein